MEWRPTTHKLLSEQIQRLSLGLHNVLSDNEKVQNEHARLVEQVVHIQTGFSVVEVNMPIVPLYSALVTTQSHTKTLISFCQDVVYKAHASVAENARALLETLDSLITNLTPSVISAVALMGDIQEHKLQEQISHLQEAEHSLNKAYIDLKSASEEAKQVFDKVRNIEDNLNSRGDSLLSEYQQVLHSRVRDAQDEIQSFLQSAQDGFDTYTSRSERKINELTTRALSEHKDYISLLAESFEEQEQELTNRIQVRIQNAENVAFELTKKIDSTHEELSGIAQSQKRSFNSFAKEIRDEIVTTIENASSGSLQELQLEQAKALNSFNEQVNENVGAINGRINQEVKEFETKKTEITEILGEISTAYQAGANSRQADKEETAANKYRIAGIIGLIVTIFCSIWLFNDYIQFFGKPEGTVTPIGELGIGWFALRFMTITLLTTPSIYMLKESAAHRSKENVYRQRSTHLSSIGAYTDELPAPEKAQLKKELAANFFSLYDGKPDTSNVPDFIKNLNEAIKMAQAIKAPQSDPAPKKETTNAG
ncbi:hypothetical protein DA093_03350 [Vibrio rotiferianus]|nr:hypothetical protein DA095_09270 [Vibrio rotiferianus]TMX59130.1 hypothetical protein DA093_03350 [Vibrio rotiferianus]